MSPPLFAYRDVVSLGDDDVASLFPIQKSLLDELASICSKPSSCTLTLVPFPIKVKKVNLTFFLPCGVLSVRSPEAFVLSYH